MLSWFRGWCRGIASVALVSLVTLTISSALPHADDCHGAECAAVALHDASDHSIGRTHGVSEHEHHCIACHLTRSVRPAPETTQLFAPVAAKDDRIALDVFTLPSQTSLLRPSLRAPPASRSLA
jgi:hypothetical protein